MKNLRRRRLRRRVERTSEEAGLVAVVGAFDQADLGLHARWLTSEPQRGGVHDRFSVDTAVDKGHAAISRNIETVSAVGSPPAVKCGGEPNPLCLKAPCRWLAR